MRPHRGWRRLSRTWRRLCRKAARVRPPNTGLRCPAIDPPLAAGTTFLAVGLAAETSSPAPATHQYHLAAVNEGWSYQRERPPTATGFAQEGGPTFSAEPRTPLSTLAA